MQARRVNSVRQWILVVPPALLALAGGAAALVGSAYPFGRLTAMGPGFLPVALGLLLAVIGAGLVVLAVREVLAGPERPDVLPPTRLRPLGAVVAGMVVWALVAERAGLIPATVALVIISSAAWPSPRWRSVLWLALALGTAGYFLFVTELGVPLAAFGR